MPSKYATQARKLSERFPYVFPSYASLTGGYAHLVTPWQKAYSIMNQKNKLIFSQYRGVLSNNKK